MFICCWAWKLLNCFNCDATELFVFVLNLDMVKSRGWSSCGGSSTCEGCCSSIGIFSGRFCQMLCDVKSMLLLLLIVFNLAFVWLSTLLFWVTGGRGFALIHPLTNSFLKSARFVTLRLSLFQVISTRGNLVVCVFPHWNNWPHHRVISQIWWKLALVEFF